MPDFEHLGEFAETLREAATEFRRSGMSVRAASLAVPAMQALAKVGVEPSRLADYSRLVERLAQGGEGAPEVVQAALEMQRLEETTGLGYEALVKRVRELSEQRRALETEVADLGAQQKEVEGLKRERERLQGEVADLVERRQSLQMDVDQREHREAELTKRVQQLEQRAHAADERLAVARKAIEDIATMGLPIEELPGLAQRMGAIAQRHKIAPADVRQRLFAELEKLDEAIGLEALIKARKGELAGLSRDVEKCEGDKKALQGAVTRLRREQRRLESSLVVLREQATTQVAKAGEEVAASVRLGGEGLRSELNGLLQQIVDLGLKVAKLDANMRSHEWVSRLVSLVEGKDGVKPEEVRKLAVFVLSLLHTWVEDHREHAPPMAGYELDKLINSFRGWKA